MCSQRLASPDQLVNDGPQRLSEYQILDLHRPVVLRRPDVDQRRELNAILGAESWIVVCPPEVGLLAATVQQKRLSVGVKLARDLITVDFSSRYNAFVDPRYVLRLAELLDQNGEAEDARRQYLRFAGFWADADAQFQPMVERARARAAKLGG